LLGVACFAMTLPTTRLAVRPVADPQLPPLFVTAGGAAWPAALPAMLCVWPQQPASAAAGAGFA
jgi:hypothetical protein